MMRRLAPALFVLTTIVGFMVGFTVRPRTGPVAAEPRGGVAPAEPISASARATSPGAVNFADVAARLNPAVVNVEAASRSRQAQADRQVPQRELFDEVPDDGGDAGDPVEPELPDEGSGSGFIVEADGHILTNHHVIAGADRVTVKLADGRSLRAVVIGSDPATDVALIKVDAGAPLPVAPLGDSAGVRVGEWVCAIGNPLAYEHTVTVGVVSFLGRKLFDASLDDYIQTDAAINFGSSGGPLINARGEVIGMNAAISRKARNIGFAIPINQARAILPQLKSDGRVARGYLGVTLRDLDPDLSKSLRLSPSAGALVQDVTEGSPGARAGIRPYDVIVSVDGTRVRTNDDLIRHIAARPPGMGTTLQVLRDGRELSVALRLGERPSVGEEEGARPAPARGTPRPADTPSIALGVSVRDLDRSLARRLHVPDGMRGVVVSAVDPLGPAYEAGVERGDIILEVNRVPVPALAEYLGATRAARPGDVLAFFCYLPDLGQRALRAVRVEASQE
ncbi:MAG: trypsin-like peptidase domain-containing protein [Acidobacteria bacterium]|jgi:serine protease Do|nr:trypsin-like peptidase domain-containing protein [Acidobacteriota bacterium]